MGNVGIEGAMESSLMDWSQSLVPRGELVGGVFRLQMSVGLISYSPNRVAAECCGSDVGRGSWWLAEMKPRNLQLMSSRWQGFLAHVTVMQLVIAA